MRWNKKVLTVLLKCFPKKLNNIINEVLTQVWNCLVQSSEVYVSKVINSDSAPPSNQSANDKPQDSIDFEGNWFGFISPIISVLIFPSCILDEKTSFENLIYQLFEFIQVLKDKKKFKPTIKKAIDELCYFAILYMQINDDQVCFVLLLILFLMCEDVILLALLKLENWSSNPEQFVQDEDDESYSYSVRISAQELIEVNS